MFRTLYLLLLALAMPCCFTKVSYEGYQVHRLIPQNNDQLASLRELEKSNNYNFWTDASQAGFPIDIMVPPQLKTDFLEYLLHQNLSATLWINDVQARIDLGKREKSVDFDWSNYQTLEEINAWLDELVEKYPGIVSPVVGGRSYEGRKIRGVRVSFGPNKKGAFIEGGIHSSEWIAPATVTYILNQILTNQEPKVRSAVESRDWYIFPSVNPDGYVYTHTTDRLWRKNRKPFGTYAGVDLNRNWNYHWMDGGASNDSCSKFYAGESAFSEIEAKSLSEYINSVADNLDIYLAFHSYFQLFLIPYGHQGLEKPENNDELHRIGNIAARSLVNKHGTRFLVGNSAETLYTASGLSIDWVKASYKHIRIVYLIELRDTGEHGLLLPPDQIIPTGEETFDAMITIIEQANA